MHAKQIRRIKIGMGSSKVLVKIIERVTDERTASGIIKIADTDTDWNPAMHANRRGVVIAAPRGRLKFKQGDNFMPWETQVEISVGMNVLFDYMAGMNCETITDEEGFEYKLLDYSDIYVATFPRKNKESVNAVQKSKDETEYIIPLNGFHIFERLHHESRSKFDIFGPMRINRKLGKVAYVAKNNAAYENGLDEDLFNLKKGDVVQFGNVPEVTLEDEAHCHFDGGTMYRRAQARNIELIWRDGELIVPNGSILIKQIPDEKVTDAGIILLKENVKAHTGKVILSSNNQIAIGSDILYIPGTGQIIKYKEEDHRVLKESMVLYVR